MRQTETADAPSQGSADDTKNAVHSNRTQLLLSCVLGLLVALLVTGPIIGRGYLMLLDWIPGPHADLQRTLWGLDGGLTTSVLLHLGNAGLGATVGSEMASWLPFVAFFPLALISMSKLVPGGYMAKTAAGALYALNPFVVDRLWVGHIAVLIGYALLPFFVRSLMVASKSEGLARLRPALWIAVLTGITPHYLWICGLLFVVTILFGRRQIRDLGWALFSLVVVVATSLYILSSSGAESDGFAVGQADLEAYDTRAALPGGIYTSVALLQGFWRLDLFFPTMSTAMTFIVFALIFTVIALGVRQMLREHRQLLSILGLTAAVAYFLALGTSGPTGWLFQFAFNNVPGFAIMREPQKFVALIALFYAVCFGVGAAYLVNRVKTQLQASFVVTATMILPFLIGANALFGFQGEIKATEYPDAYAKAADLMGEGDGALLWLPWHQYASQPFTGGRIVAEPAGQYFERHVIVGDNVELPELVSSSQSPRSAYIEGLLARGNSMSSFGQLTAPLGVEYIAVVNTNDFRRYEWIIRQDDLEVVLETRELLLLRNTKFQGVGYPVTEARQFADLDELVEVSDTTDLSSVVATSQKLSTADAATGSVRRISNVEFETEVIGPAHLVIGEVFDEGWKNTSDIAPMSGTLLTDEMTGKFTISYSPWQNLQLLYALSVTTFVLVLFASNYGNLRNKSARQRPLTLNR